MKSIRAVMFAAAISMASSTAVFAADSVTAEAPVETAIETTEAAEATETTEADPTAQADTAAATEGTEPAEDEPLAPLKQYRAYLSTPEEIRWIAAIAVNENGYDANAIRYEVSLICNLTDAGGHGSTPYAVVNSNWFARTTKQRARKTAISNEVYNIVADVLSGNRVTDCNEHDNVNDIVSITTNGVTLVSQADIRDRNNYVGGATIIRNRFGATYRFECFPAKGTDPFGILVG